MMKLTDNNGETGKEYFAGQELIRRPDGDGYLLTERQSILVAMLAGQEEDHHGAQVKKLADAIRLEVVEVIYALRHGQKVPPMPVLDDLLKDFSPWQR